jgi:opacity protein-like surface antigen
MLRISVTAAAAAAGAAALVAADAAHAQSAPDEPGLYLEGGASYLEFDGENGVDAEVSALTGRAGMRFNSWLALEGDASFGIEDGDFAFSGGEDDFDLDDNSDGDVADVINAPGDFGMDYMLGGFLRATAPISDRFSIYGRAGYSFVEVESTVTTPGGATLELGDSESGASIGGGAELHFTERQSARLDYTFTDFDLAEAEALGLTYQFRF